MKGQTVWGFGFIILGVILFIVIPHQVVATIYGVIPAALGIILIVFSGREDVIELVEEKNGGEER